MKEKNELNLLLYFNHNCNLRCEYCFSDSTRGNMSDETFEKLFDNMKNSKRIFKVGILGGEPLLFKKTKVWVERILELENVKGVYLFTNATQKIPFDDFSKLKIVFSYHPSEVDNDKYKKTCEENIKTKKRFLVSFLLPYKREFVQKTKEMIEFLLSKNIYFNLNFVRDGINVKEYRDEILLNFSFLDELSFEHVKSPLNGKRIIEKFSDLRKLEKFIKIQNKVCDRFDYIVETDGSLYSECAKKYSLTVDHSFDNLPTKVICMLKNCYCTSFSVRI